MKYFDLLQAFLCIGLSKAYLVAPPGTPAPGATQQCSDWVQSSYDLTCDIVTRELGMTLAQFQQWNPSTAQFGSDCSMIQGLYYCVEVDFIKLTTSTTQTTLSTTTTSPTTTPPTTTGNGITTPIPVQSGMVTNCNKFYLVVSGDGCYDIASSQGVSLDNLYAWNPAIGTSCQSLLAATYICVGLIGSPTAVPTTSMTRPGNGIATPTPTQSSMVSNCRSFHLVVSGDTCYDISAAAGVSLSNFYAWNKGVGSSCQTLPLGYYVCVAVL